jgi:S1-C subfamily serine protease
LKQHIKLLFYVSFIFNAYSALARENDGIWDNIRFSGLDQTKQYNISSGTGFYVNEDLILTSKHVVENCENIAVRGAMITPHRVELFSSHESEDLALLSSPLPPYSTPYFRVNYDQIKLGDNIFTIGYPLDRSQSGLYIQKQANISNISKNTQTGFKEFEFTDSIDHGNSGGPILDSGLNIIGLVKAKISYKDSKNQVKKYGIAVGLQGILNFLDSNRIEYKSIKTVDLVQNYTVDDKAQSYIVNIHCISRNN